MNKANIMQITLYRCSVSKIQIVVPFLDYDWQNWFYKRFKFNTTLALRTRNNSSGEVILQQGFVRPYVK